MSTIQLLIRGEGNRTAIRDLLEDRYDVDTEQSVGEADVYVVDDRSFPEYHESLRDRIEASQPVFCPVVLIRRRNNPQRITLPDPERRDDPLLVDDVVEAPVTRSRLLRRLNTLLVRRNQSKRLRHYVSELEKSNERLEQFAYAASHDLQEPLRMVTSYLRLLEDRYDDALDEDAEEFLEFAVDGADRMREMIDGLLEYSRVETRGDPFETVDLDAALDAVLADLQIQIEESGAEITAADLPRVEGDASQVRQVLQNLLSNAITYCGDEPPRIDVGAERRGREWVISVRDEGIGIDPDHQDRVFTVFDRLHSRDEYEGTGIGLALCQRIVERHGGEIWVDSAPGEGSTFSFTLPAADAPPAH